MSPTLENITEVATARIAAIRAKAHELGDYESTDERLLRIVITDANRLATTLKTPPATAQQAVAWAIVDMYSKVVDPAEVAS